MISFEFGNVGWDGAEPGDCDDLVYGLEADFRIVTTRGTLYEEPSFPILELAQDLLKWLHDGFVTHTSFEWDSMQTPEPGWVWIRREGDGWRVGSINQEFPDITLWRSAEIERAIRNFASAVDRWLKSELGRDCFSDSND